MACIRKPFLHINKTEKISSVRTFQRKTYNFNRYCTYINCWTFTNFLLYRFRFDARGKALQQGIHWADIAVFTSKVHFYYDSNPPSLRIQAINLNDAGLYRCRVDFQKSPTRNSRINLTVLGTYKLHICSMHKYNPRFSA